ncbi:hypothetical protein [Kitasatospora arboriphila]
MGMGMLTAVERVVQEAQQQLDDDALSPHHESLQEPVPTGHY